MLANECGMFFQPLLMTTASTCYMLDVDIVANEYGNKEYFFPSLLDIPLPGRVSCSYGVGLVTKNNDDGYGLYKTGTLNPELE